jgi:glycosyltransferase involved in cell wall biosynthesis
MAPNAALVIPAYNAADTIQETLLSIQSQQEGLGDIREVIVADDGSTDETVLRVRECWSCPTPLRILEREKNVGQWSNLNEAIDRLDPDLQWFFILHADDIAQPNWLKEMLGVMRTCESRVASVTASYDLMFPDGRIEYGEDFGDARRVNIKGTGRSIADTIKRGCWWKISSCSIRLAAYREIGSFRPEFPYMSDLDFLLRLLAAGWCVEYIPLRLTIYRQIPSSISSRSFQKHQDIREWLDVIRDFSPYLSLKQVVRRLASLAVMLLRRIVSSALRRDWRRAGSAAGLLGTVAGFAVGLMHRGKSGPT